MRVGMTTEDTWVEYEWVEGFWMLIPDKNNNSNAINNSITPSNANLQLERIKHSFYWPNKCTKSFTHRLYMQFYALYVQVQELRVCVDNNQTQFTS